jgi:hypothetical protein
MLLRMMKAHSKSKLIGYINVIPITVREVILGCADQHGWVDDYWAREHFGLSSAV